MTAETRAALVVGDCQEGIVRNFGDDAEFLKTVRQAIDGARAAGIPVIFVTVAFRAGHPEISPANRMWAPVAANNLMLEGDAVVGVHPDLGRAPEEPLIVKRRVGAFTGTDLEVLLRSQGINQIVLAGIATSGVILSTVRAAADLDYAIVVLSDAVKDGDDEVQRVLLEKVFPRQADVLTVEDWLART
jgi:nicotinamidase-related amidase